MNKYLEAEKWILDRGTHKGPYSLDKIEYLLDELDAPQREYACILIGGTNGKGSVTAITESILLHCQDYQVGSYTSPHLLSLKERIKIQGEPVPEKLIINGVKELKEITKVMDKESSLGAPAFFVIMTALGFWAFRESDIDIALVEVGLGGRFDSTNACEPEISVITNIGTDHQQYLGDTKEKIAHEKLGIIRKNLPEDWMNGRGFCTSSGNCRTLPSGLTVGEASAKMADYIKGGKEALDAMIRTMYTSPIEGLNPEHGSDTKYIHTRFALMDKEVRGMVTIVAVYAVRRRERRMCP